MASRGSNALSAAFRTRHTSIRLIPKILESQIFKEKSNVSGLIKSLSHLQIQFIGKLRYIPSNVHKSIPHFQVDKD